MTLQEKVQYIQNTLAEIHRDVAAALTIQGLYREPEDFYLQEIGDLIRLIKTEDFQFRYDFKALDSVGRIRSRQEGISVGNSGIKPTMVSDIPRWFVVDFSCSTPISFPITYANGQECGGMSISSSMDDIWWPRLDFKKCDCMPDTLIPLPQE